jgi:hypothetical protein
MKKEYCKGYKSYMKERVYVTKRPYIEWRNLNNDNVQTGFIDGIPVCAVDKRGFLSCLEFDKEGNFKNVLGVRALTGGAKFKNKLNAMKSAYLHIPIFFEHTSHKGKIKSFFGKYYDIEFA